MTTSWNAASASVVTVNPTGTGNPACAQRPRLIALPSTSSSRPNPPRRSGGQCSSRIPLHDVSDNDHSHEPFPGVMADAPLLKAALMQP